MTAFEEMSSDELLWQPVYAANHALKTPHSGYHWQGQQRFFEGWYYRLTLPERRYVHGNARGNHHGNERGNGSAPDYCDRGQTIAFMYSIQDPAGGTPLSGSTVQILGPDEQYFCRTFADVMQFWADENSLSHGCSRSARARRDGSPTRPEGYRATAQVHQGLLRDPKTTAEMRWHYTIEPVYGWGNPQAPQQATAGWMSFLPVFEPGWQILMAHGLATGWIDLAGRCYRLDRVPFYAEKNWGGAFPSKWFWMQCNAFTTNPELTVTAGGGLRQMLGRIESVGMVGIHWRGRFYEFVPWNSRVRWEVSPWGSWRVWAENGEFSVELVGHTTEPGVKVRVPTPTGMEFCCRDTTRGQLRLRLWRGVGESRQQQLSAVSQQAGLEVGGSPWEAAWSQK